MTVIFSYCWIFLCPLAFTVTIEKSDANITVTLQGICLFSLAPFKILSLLLFFYSFTFINPDVHFFVYSGRNPLDFLNLRLHMNLYFSLNSVSLLLSSLFMDLQLDEGWTFSLNLSCLFHIFLLLVNAAFLFFFLFHFLRSIFQFINSFFSYAKN